MHEWSFQPVISCRTPFWFFQYSTNQNDFLTKKLIIFLFRNSIYWTSDSSFFYQKINLSFIRRLNDTWNFLSFISSELWLIIFLSNSKHFEKNEFTDTSPGFYANINIFYSNVEKKCSWIHWIACKLLIYCFCSLIWRQILYGHFPSKMLMR